MLFIFLSNLYQGEIKAMKAEIHRMEVRYTQLMRQQEKMIQDMEKSVFKRESIIVRGDAQAKMQRKKLGKPKLDKVKRVWDESKNKSFLACHKK